MSNYNPGETLERYGRIQAESKYRRDLAEQRRKQAEYERQARQYARDQELEAAAIRRQQEAALRQQEARQKAVEEEQSKNNGGFFGGLGYAGAKVGTGLLRGLEGIWDFIAGGAADLFGAHDWAKEQMENSPFDNWNQSLDEWYNPGKGWEFVGDVTGGIGQMLPSIAITVASGGSAAPVAMGMFMTSAAGQSVSDATKQTGELGLKEWGYGTASGIAEGAIEYASGGIGGSQMGKVLGKQLAKSTAGKVATTFIGEGIEEVASDLLDPALRRISGVDPNARVDVEQLPKTFLVGGTVGAALGGGTRAIQAKQAGGVNNFYAQEQGRTINESKAMGDELQTRNKLTETKTAKLNEQQQKTAESLSERLQKMSPEARKNIIDGNRLSNLFNADGSLRSTLTASEVSSNQEAYSYSLRGQEETLQYKPTTEAVNDTQKTVISEVEKMTQGKVKTVITDSMRTADGQRADAAFHDGILYIDKNANAQKVATIHEITHSLEGTDSYGKFADFVFEEIKNSPELSKKYGDYMTRLTDTALAYEAQTKNMTPEQARYVAQTELVSQYTGEMFGNEEFVGRLSKAQPNVAQRLWQWIKDKIKVLTAKGGDRETIAFLQKAEKLYRNALSDSAGGVKLSELNFEDEAKTVEAKGESGELGDVRVSLRESVETLQKYTEQEIARIEADKRYHVARTHEEIVDFIKKARASVTAKFLFLGKIHENLATKIKEATGLDILGKSFVLNSNDIAHIFRNHGNQFSENARGQIAISEQNIENILETMIEPDSITKDIDHNNVSSVIFKKNIGGMATAITLFSEKKKALTLKSAWITKKEQSISPSRDVQAPRPTSETLGSMKTTLNEESIAQSDASVNSVRNIDEKDSKRYLLAKDDDSGYNGKKNGETENGREENRTGLDRIQARKHDSDVDNGGVRLLRGILESSSDESFRRRAENFARRIVERSRLKIWDEEAVLKKSKELGIDTHFCETKKSNNEFVFDGKNLFVSEKITTDQFGQILDKIKPYRNDPSVRKTAHISTSRWNKFIAKHPDAFIAKVSIQDFLDLTGDKLTQRYVYDESMESRRQIEDPSELYLEVDFESGKVSGHEGRHRMYTLLESGYTDIDIFVIPKGKISVDSIDKITLKAQEGSRKVSLWNLLSVNQSGQDQFIDWQYRVIRDNNIRYSIAETQRTKVQANYTQDKVYSKKEAAEAIDDVLSSVLTEDEVLTLGSDAKLKAADMLFARLNKAADLTVRRQNAGKIADYIVENATLESIYEDSFAAEEMKTTLAETRGFMGTLRLDGIEAEIAAKYGKKAARIMLAWGQKNGQNGTTGPDVAVQELAERGIHLDVANDADAFFAIKELYDISKMQLRKEADRLVREVTSPTERKKIKDDLTNEILKAYDTYGKASFKAKTVGAFNARIADLKKKLVEVQKENKITNQILDTAQSFKEIKKRTGADVLADPELEAYIKTLGGIKYRSDIRKSDTRKRIVMLDNFYNKEKLATDGEYSYFDQNVRDAIDYIKERVDDRSRLSLDELEAVNVVLGGIKHLYKNYDVIRRNGKNEILSDMVERAFGTLGSVKKYQSRNVVSKQLFRLGTQIAEPRVIIAALEGYLPDGQLTQLFNDLTAGETKAQITKIQILEEVDVFLKEHKKYERHLRDTLSFKGVEITVDDALQIYLTAQREAAKSHLENGGVSVETKEGVKDIRGITKMDVKELYEKFSDDDKFFLDVARRMFNDKASQVKIETDSEILGYTNVSATTDYIPMRTDKTTIARGISDARNAVRDLQNVYNFSFNKDLRPNAKNQLAITGLLGLMQNHASQIGVYAGLTQPLQNFDKFYNKNLGTKDDVRSVKKYLNREIWSGTDQYISNLLQDMQGSGRQKTVKALSWVRGGYAKFQLGLNGKVILSQTASYPSALQYLSGSSMLKALGMKWDGANLDKYSDYARARNYNSSIVMAEGLIDKLDKKTEIFTKPIQKTDRLTVGTIWNACKVETETKKGLKFGTEENYKAAAELFEEVCRKTQPNYSASERSALMRSESELLRTMTMFTSVPLKQVSRTIEAWGQYLSYRQLVKDGKLTAAELKTAKTNLVRATASTLMANAMYVAIGLMFKWLTGRKDDEGEELNYLSEFGKDMLGTYANMVPIFRDLYGAIANDYEINNYAFDSINNLVDATKQLYGMAEGMISGKPMTEADFMRPLRSSAYAVGQLFGVPVRNVWNQLYGLTKRFSPETAYQAGALFTNNTNYNKEIKRAIAGGNTDYALAVARTEIKSRGASGAAADELAKLYLAGESVMPKQTVEKVTIDGEEVALTNAQIKAFDKAYKAYLPAVESLLGSAEYKALDDAGRARAVRFIEEYYYAQAVESVLKISKLTARQRAAELIPAEKLAVYLAAISEIEGKTDKAGKVVAGSRKEKVFAYINKLPLSAAQKYVLMGLAGYKNEKGRAQTESLIRSKVRDKDAAAELLVASGY